MLPGQTCSLDRSNTGNTFHIGLYPCPSEWGYVVSIVARSDKPDFFPGEQACSRLTPAQTVARPAAVDTRYARPGGSGNSDAHLQRSGPPSI